MKSDTQVSDDFETHFATNAGHYLDPELIAETARDWENWSGIVKTLGFTDPDVITTFASSVGPTVAWLKSFGVKFDFLPTYFITACQPRMAPIGGGLALVEALAGWCEKNGAQFFYQTTARELMQNGDGAVIGLRGFRPATSRSNWPGSCGGACLRRLRGQSRNAHALSRAPRPLHPAGGARRLLQQGRRHPHGARRSAPRPAATTAVSTPSRSIRAQAPPSRWCMVFNYGILVNTTGPAIRQRGAGDGRCHLRGDHAGHFRAAGRHRLLHPRCKNRRRTQLETLGALRPAANRGRLRCLNSQASSASTRANSPQRSRPIMPPARPAHSSRSNSMAWRQIPATRRARPIGRGGSRSRRSSLSPSSAATASPSAASRSIRPRGSSTADGGVIPGLYAAGETIGLYYGTYAGATSVLRGAVFGRIAGAHAAAKAC